MRVAASLSIALLLASGCGRGPLWRDVVQRVERCSAVDFLFVIDNSESMQVHQDNLRANFNPFIEGIYDSLDDVGDFHVGVVTTDAYRDNADECKRLGALVTSVDAGPGNLRTDCGPYAEGHRYMTEADDLTQTFNCAAAVGTDGQRSEEPMEALQYAITPRLSDWYEECNGDFIRDDALLVSVVITDEEDGEYVPGSNRQDPGPDQWFRNVVEVKGLESNVVVVSLLNGVTPDCPADDPTFIGANLASFTERFSHGFVGGICQPDYGPIFDAAVDGIDDACSTYTLLLD